MVNNGVAGAIVVGVGTVDKLTTVGAPLPLPGRLPPLPRVFGSGVG